MTMRFIICFAILSFLFLHCKDNSQGDSTVAKAFLGSLAERQVGQLSYYISIPKNYVLKEQEGPDFSVFYFEGDNKNEGNGFSGGMYFGNFPNEFPAENDSCGTRTIHSQILRKKSTWTVYECKGELTVQTIVDSKSGEGWNSQIHVFGHAKNEDDLDKLLAVYSTLRKEN